MHISIGRYMMWLGLIELRMNTYEGVQDQGTYLENKRKWIEIVLIS